MDRNRRYPLLSVLFTTVMSVGCSFGYFISLHRNQSSWQSAIKTCKEHGGMLASYNQVLLSATTCRNYTKDFNAIWTSNLFIRTPFLLIVGCYKTSDRVFAANTSCSTCNSVPGCYAYCALFDHFGMTGKGCFCLTKPERHAVGERQNATLCEKENNKYMDEYMTVYKKSLGKTKSAISDGDQKMQSKEELYIISACRYGIPTSKLVIEFIVKNSSEDDAYYPVCRNLKTTNISVLNTAYKDWKSANEACIENTGDYLMHGIPEDEANRTCHDFNATLGVPRFLYAKSLWSAQRTYVSESSLQEYLKTSVPMDSIICMVASGHNLTIIEDQSCETGKYGFFCVTDKLITNICHMDMMEDTEDASFSVFLKLTVLFAGVVTVIIISCLLCRWLQRRKYTLHKVRESAGVAVEHGRFEMIHMMSSNMTDHETVYSHTSTYMQKINRRSASW